MEKFTFFVLMLDATARVSVPLVLASMAGLFAERTEKKGNICAKSFDILPVDGH